MSSRKHLILLVLLLISASLAIFIYKAKVLHWPLSPSMESSVWTVEAKLTFTALPDRPIKASFFIPGQQPHLAIIDENYVSRSYGINTRKQQSSNRLSVWTTRRASGTQTLYYRLLVHPEDMRESLETATAPDFPELDPTIGEAERSAIEVILGRVRTQSYDTATFAIGVLKELQDVKDNHVAILLGRDLSTARRVAIAQKILAGAHIPSRSVHGLVLSASSEQRQQVPFDTLLSVWNGKEWVYCDPTTSAISLPENFLIWWTGEEPLFDVDGGKNATVTVSTKSNLQSTLDIIQTQAEDPSRNAKVWTLSLFSLPLEAQHAYQALIMIPLGALAVLLLRNVIGIKTFGTFMPVLIALAFRETTLITGILLFIFIVSLGLAIRFYLEHLKLLLFPRIAAVLSIVVLIMMSTSIIGHRLGFDYGVTITLFPMVILTMTIERMSVLWEERGPWDAMVQGAGSLFSASIAYMVMSNAYAKHLVFVFPELLFIVIAMMLLMGRYRGYRLSELYRFKSLVNSKAS